MTYLVMRQAGRCGVWTHLARFVFFALVAVELLLVVVGLSKDGDLRFRELVDVAEGGFPSVFWSRLQFLESAVAAIVGD